MQNFTYHNPTKIIFGQGTIPQVGGECATIGKKALLLYGKGSIKRNGVYDRVVASLKQAGVEWVELDGVKANPTLDHTHKGIALAKREQVDLVLAVGGGSVIDEAKAICAGTRVEHDVWDFYMRKAVAETALPLVAVLTMSATGTEMNGGTVITNEATDTKLGMGFDALYPRTSILDPETLFTVPSEQTAYGCIDATTHLLEGYFTGEDRFTPLQDRYVEGIIRTLTEIAASMIERPRDYALRSTFMWAATLAWNGTAPSGIGAWNTPNHLIGHSMSSLYDTPHGASLSIALTSWMPWYARSRPERLAQLGRAVFDIHDADPSEAARKTIDAFVNWFQSLGSPTTLRDIDADLDAFAENVGRCAPLWGLPAYTKEFIVELFKTA